MTKVKHYDYEGCHAMADIVLKGEIPSNIEEIIKEAIEKSNLNIVDNISHKFVPQGETSVYVLSESHFVYHTYPESNYLTCCCYTCGEEGDPEAAIEYLLSLLNVKKKSVKYLKRGLFDNIKISLNEKNIFNKDKNEIKENQNKLDNICKSLSKDQKEDLNSILDWCLKNK